MKAGIGAALLAWLDRFPLALLAFLAVWMAVAPISPEPHLVEKTRMLLSGTLLRPMDIFDLLFHLTPGVLLVLRLVRKFKK